MSSSSFGIIGLGTMGRNLALNIESHGFRVAVWNLETRMDRQVPRGSPRREVHRRQDAARSSRRRSSGLAGS